MTALDWFLSITLFVIYIFCLFTVCVLTFRKGYTLLGIIGIFIPILWLIGAVLPAKPNSHYAIDRDRRETMQIEAMGQ
jgi:hypothetical protein